jgi:hypothetical protein
MALSSLSCRQWARNLVYDASEILDKIPLRQEEFQELAFAWR